ncbi:MAG: DUF5916 domain-containing protein, partial [Candidatus Poribacteria bacterium]|nr:DUF5916 domain-containing protein [Candidatus Poribacteria bacterium]
MKTSAMGVARATLWLTAFTFIFLLSRSAYAHDLSDPNAPPVKTVRAIRVDSNAPKIDGVLDDDVWKTAPITGDFTLREPREHQGDPASEKTTAQFAYDDDALYVGIICYDSEPDKIIANLVRRDSWDDSDRIGFDIDTHHDHSTGYYFYAYASGSVGDIYNQSDDNNVQSWNGVWDCKVARGDYGWSVEMRIPYHVLRFSPKDDYTWGINLQRWIQRKKERNQWVLVPDGTSGWIPHYGHLVGISGIQPPKHLEFIPYTRGRSIFSPKNEVNTDGRDLSGAFGGDVRYGISSNISLNATINPDFGQVEADPAELNLTVFESF